jgi:hypothetical protein
VTADERFRQCMSVGGNADACHELVLSEMVNGVWCDGVVYYDASGKRCITRIAPRQTPTALSTPQETHARSFLGLVLVAAAVAIVVSVVAR